MIAAARVVTISITAEALAAIEATLADGSAAARRRDGKGAISPPLPHGMLDRMKASAAWVSMAPRFSSKWCRKIPQFGGRAISRGRDRRCSRAARPPF